MYYRNPLLEYDFKYFSHSRDMQSVNLYNEYFSDLHFERLNNGAPRLSFRIREASLTQENLPRILEILNYLVFSYRVTITADEHNNLIVKDYDLCFDSEPQTYPYDGRLLPADPEVWNLVYRYMEIAHIASAL